MFEQKQVVMQGCTVKRLIEVLSTIKDKDKPVYGVNGMNIGNNLVVTHQTHGIVLDFRL